MQNFNWLSIEKTLWQKKHFVIIIRKYINLENFASYQEKYKQLFSFGFFSFGFQVLQVSF